MQCAWPCSSPEAPWPRPLRPGLPVCGCTATPSLSLPHALCYHTCASCLEASPSTLFLWPICPPNLSWGWLLREAFPGISCPSQPLMRLGSSGTCSQWALPSLRFIQFMTLYLFHCLLSFPTASPTYIAAAVSHLSSQACLVYLTTLGLSADTALLCRSALHISAHKSEINQVLHLIACGENTVIKDLPIILFFVDYT